MYNFVLYNSYVHKIFLQHRSYEGQDGSARAPRGRRRSSDVTARPADRPSRVEYNLLHNEENEPGDQIMAKILEGISKNSKYYTYHCIAIVFIQLTVMVKEVVVILLRRLPEDSPYRLWDCALLGRTSITGTFTRISQRFGLVLSGLQVMWASYHILFEPPVRLSCLEFLMHSPEQVEAIELECCHEDTSQLAEPVDQVDEPSDISVPTQRHRGWSTRSSDAFLSTDSASRAVALGQPTIYYVVKRPEKAVVRYPIFQYREPELRKASKCEQCASTSEIRYRKNRGLDYWRRLTHSSVRYFLMCILVYTLASVPLMYCMGSVLITKQGFELNYSTCVNYIRSLDPDKRRPWSFIYVPDDASNGPARAKPLGPALEYVDIMPFNDFYHAARVLADLFQSVVVFNIIGISKIAESYHAVVVARDIEHYLTWLEAGLDELVNDLRFDRTARRQTMQLDAELHPIGRHQVLLEAIDSKSVPGRRRSIVRTKRNKMHLAKQISDLQAQLMDFFMMISRYNTYIQNFLWIVIAVWVVYSATAADYLLAPDGVIYWDVLFGQLFSTVYFIVVVGHFAMIRRRIRRLYPLITSAMALDDDCVDSKIRWPSIMTYYYPKPLYCFTVGGFTISWNFCLQVSFAHRCTSQRHSV